MADPFDSVSFASAINEFEQFIQGLAGQTQEGSAEAAQGSEGAQTAQDQAVQASEGAQAAQGQPAQASEGAQGAEPPAPPEIEDELIKELMAEKPAEKAEKIDLVAALRDPAKLEELAEKDPRLAYQTARMLMEMQRFLSQTRAAAERPAQAQPPQGQPQQPLPAEPPAQTLDPYLQQLLSLREFFTRALQDAQQGLQAIRQAPIVQTERQSAEQSIENLLGIASQEQPTEPQRETLLSQIARDVQEAKILTRIGVIDQLLRQVNQEIAARETLQTLQSAQTKSALETIQQSYAEVREQVLGRLNDVLEKVNQQLGVNPYGEIIAHATRNQLLNDGVNLDQELLRIAAAPQAERPAAVENLTRMLARYYIQNAKRLATRAQSPSGEAQVKHGLQTPTQPPAQNPGTTVQRSEAATFEEATKEFVRALQAADRYLSGGLPSSLSKL